LVPTAVLLLFVALGSQSYAQTYAYSTNNGAWSNAATWNTLPVDGLSAIVTGGNTVTFGAGDSYTGSDPWGWGPDGVGGLGVGGGVEYGPAGAGTLDITGGTLTSGGMWAGHGGTGTINLSGGTLNIGGQHMLFGWNYSSSLNVSGGTLNMTGSGNIFRFGNSGQSFMNITTNGVANLSGSGIDLLASSQINVNGGTLNLTNTTQANSIVNVTAGSQMVVRGGGTLNMQAGTQTMNTAESLWLGYGGTTGTLNLSGGTWQQNTFMRMGVFANGNGIINQTGGTFEMGGAFEAWGSSPSAYNLSGGTFRTTANGVAINSYSGGAMTFNITGSSGNVTMDTPYDFTAPNTSVFNNAAATLTKTGAGKLTVAGQLDIRNGAFSMSNGTLDTSTGTLIGTEGGTASGTMSGGTLKNGYLGGANFSVGYNGGTGTFTQSGGTNQVGSLANAVIGWNSGSVGTYTLDGGSYSATNNTFIGLGGGAGTVNVNGGSFAAYNLLVGGNGAASGTLNLNGGTLSVANNFSVNSNGTLNLNSGGILPAANIGLGGGGTLNFNGGTGNASLNIFAGGGAGATVELNGKTLGVDTWANLIGSGTNAVLKNSSATAASIAAGNTIWIWDGGQNLTIDASGGDIQIDSWITSYGQTTQTGIIKTGPKNLILTYAGNDYTGTTAINEGRVALVNGNALGSTAGGTVVASGAQLLLTNVVVVAEPLTISGNGLPSGSAIAGALRSLGTNTWQGKVTLAANAKIFSGSETSLTLDVASGPAIDLSGFTLTIDGAGTYSINDGIIGTGAIVKTGSGITTLSGSNSYSGTTTVDNGTLVVSNALLSATIRSNSVAVAFSSVPSAGTTYSILPGALAANSLVSQSVTGLGSGQTATVSNDPNLVVEVTSTVPAGPTVDSAYPGTTMTDVAPNGLTYLMNYALGGSSTTSATMPSQDTGDPTKLTLVAYVRTDNAVGTLSVVGEKGDSLSNFDTANPIPGEVPNDQSTAPAGTQKRIFSVPANGDRLFLRLKATLTP
jgi:autotransporter-associated beta strand protein